MSNVKRLGRYHDHDFSSNNHNNDNSDSQSFSNNLISSLYRNSSWKPLVDWNKPLFGNKRTSLQKLLAKANQTTERATTFINKIKSRQLACANRAKSIPENTTIRKEYIKCGKEICQHKHGPYYYAYWKILKAKS